MPTDKQYERAMEQLQKRARREAERRVTLGFAWLQTYRPGWHRHINLDPAWFNMSADSTCIWGQLAQRDLEDWFGSVQDRQRADEYVGYGEVATYLRFNPVDDATQDPMFMRTHGFSTHDGDRDHVTYAMLQEAWIPLIRALQEQDRAEAEAAAPDARGTGDGA